MLFGAWDDASGNPRGFTAEEVSAHLGTDDWLPLKRFGVVQKNKVRGCDDASANRVNGTSSRSEKVTLSSVDRIVALVRLWSQLAPGVRLGSWALDEYKAYRQIPVDPSQRRFARTLW